MAACVLRERRIAGATSWLERRLRRRRSPVVAAPEGPVVGAEVDEFDDDDTQETAVAPLRSREYKPGHRQVRPKTETPTGTSSWLNAPREGFTAQQAERAETIGATKQGSLVKGTSREY
jgi:hypothetical protein